MATPVPVRAVVTAFDRGRGLGTVRTADGDELPFHATAISDGTRDIAVGAPVLCGIVPGHAGTLEAHPLTGI